MWSATASPSLDLVLLLLSSHWAFITSENKFSPSLRDFIMLMFKCRIMASQIRSSFSRWKWVSRHLHLRLPGGPFAEILRRTCHINFSSSCVLRAVPILSSGIWSLITRLCEILVSRWWWLRRLLGLGALYGRNAVSISEIMKFIFHLREKNGWR
jgi:hypothetical protein